MASNSVNQLSARARYIKLAILVVVAGNIYPLVYLRQNFQQTILDVFELSATQLGQNYAMLGVLYVICYVPSGWLADRVAPYKLMSFSLAMAGLLGAWFATVPSFQATQIIFMGWGIATGLTFWSAMIKATAVLAQPNEQGRFFGILEGGRGLVEAILATIAVGLFAWATQSQALTPEAGLKQVIWMYASCMLILSPITYFVLKDDSDHSQPQTARENGFVQDLVTIVKKPEIWLCALCILTGYQLFWATYSFSSYLQNFYGMTAVAVGALTVGKLWMRPIGAVAAGFLGDFRGIEGLLSLLLLLSSISLVGLIVMPQSASWTVLLLMVLVIGFLTYAVRGIFWATLESCDISNSVKGLAIGLISIVGYAPDIYLPLMEGYLVDSIQGQGAYTIYFGYIAAGGVVGSGAAWMLRKRAKTLQA